MSTGEYSNAAAAEYFARYLRQRRDMIGLYWFARVNALDRFELEGGQVRGVDLAVQRGYASGVATRYQMEVRSPGAGILASEERGEPYIDLAAEWREHEYLAISFLPRRPDYKVKPVVLYLRAGGDEWEISGLRCLD